MSKKASYGTEKLVQNLAELDSFSGFEKNDLRELAASAQIRPYGAKSVVYESDIGRQNRLFVILRGVMGVFSEFFPGGKAIVGFLEKGDFLSSPIIGQKRADDYMYTYKMFCSCEVVIFPEEKMSVLVGNKTFMFSVIQGIQKRLANAHFFLGLNQLEARQKVEHVFELFPWACDLSNVDLGVVCGLARPTVSKIVSNMRREKITRGGCTDEK